MMNRFFPREYNVFHPSYWFGDIDARPVSLFRIVFGALMLKEALYHIFTAHMFYSESGLLPYHALQAVSGGERFTLLSSLPQTWMVMVFFALWALVALGLLLGWQTRIMTALNFVFLLSAVNRNPVIDNGADALMVAFAFWMLFIPLGRCYSIDARQSSPKARMVYAFPVRMLQIQLAFVYIFTTLLKLQGHAWQNGDAVYLALQAKMYAFPLGEWFLANAPLGLLQALTGYTLLVEGGFALLVFAPFLQPYLRAGGLLLGVILHIGIALMMAVPNFPLVMLSGYVVFLDSRWVDVLEKWGNNILARIGLHPVIVARDVPSSPPKRGCGGVLVDIGSSTLNGGYRAALAALLLLCLVCTLWSNILSDNDLANRLGVSAMPEGLGIFMQRAGLWQAWGMFAPEPLPNDGWFILATHNADGRTIDPRTGAPPGDVRPRWWIGPWARWLKFEENMMVAPDYSPVFPAWGAVVCAENAGMQSLEIILRTQPIVLPGTAEQPYQDRVLWQGGCSAAH